LGNLSSLSTTLDQMQSYMISLYPFKTFQKYVTKLDALSATKKKVRKIRIDCNNEGKWWRNKEKIKRNRNVEKRQTGVGNIEVWYVTYWFYIYSYEKHCNNILIIISIRIDYSIVFFYV